MSKKLTQEEINKRLTKLRNYERLYPRAAQKRDELKLENEKLKHSLTSKDFEIEKLKLRVEELERGKFRKNRDSRKKSKVLPKCKKTKKVDRPNSSYRRPEPSAESVTGEVVFEAETCPECEVELINKQENVHFVEDLKRREESLKQALEIIQVTIQSGKCPSCNTIVKAMDSPKQKVVIGENLRQMVVFKAIYMGLSYAETQRSIETEYGISFSNGQIANILAGESKLLSPYYENIVKDLQNEAAHYDETSWKTKSMGDAASEGNYCWVKVGVESEKQLIWFGKSRGKKVAEDLRGEKKDSKGVSDDYGAYKKLFDNHQLCWSHPHRKLRDLAESGELEKEKLKICKKVFKDFGEVYLEAEKFRKGLLKGDFNDEEKQKQSQELQKKFLEITKKNENDPEKLKAIRKRLKERMDKYFTFVKHPELPLDNNKAERKIRKVVLKRKKSFGSRSQKGADTLSILYSVIFTMTEENPDMNFFELYEEAAKFGRND